MNIHTHTRVRVCTCVHITPSILPIVVLEIPVSTQMFTRGNLNSDRIVRVGSRYSDMPTSRRKGMESMVKELVLLRYRCSDQIFLQSRSPQERSAYHRPSSRSPPTLELPVYDTVPDPCSFISDRTKTHRTRRPPHGQWSPGGRRKSLVVPCTVTSE